MLLVAISKTCLPDKEIKSVASKSVVHGQTTTKKLTLRPRFAPNLQLYPRQHPKFVLIRTRKMPSTKYILSLMKGVAHTFVDEGGSTTDQTCRMRA